MGNKEEILITFPNLDPQYAPVSVVKEWKFNKTNVIGDTVFCYLEDNTIISMGLEDYNIIFNEK